MLRKIQVLILVLRNVTSFPTFTNRNGNCSYFPVDIDALKLFSSFSQVKSKAGQQTKEQCWHERCLKCCMCRQTMTEKCYERDGRFYCSEDYYRFVCDTPSFLQDTPRLRSLRLRHLSVYLHFFPLGLGYDSKHCAFSEDHIGYQFLALVLAVFRQFL